MSVIKVLIVDGFSNHDWAHTTRCIRAVLAQTGVFEVSVSTFPADLEEIEAWAPNFEAFDVVVQTCNDLGGGPRWPDRVEAALEAYVEAGGGLFIFHAGNNAFVHWEGYNCMLGLGWRDKGFGSAIVIDANEQPVCIPAGEGEKTSHGPRFDALVTRLGDHPIHEGFPRQWVAADIEVYRYARGPAENISVLSYAEDPTLGLRFPIEWSVAFGSGRIYNSTLGHVWKDQAEPIGIRCVGFQTLLCRAIQWLAKKDLMAVPEDFPSKMGPCLRPYPIKN